MRQFFFLVCTEYDESTTPNKITLNELEAVRYGRRLATKFAADSPSTQVGLYKQEIARTATITRIKTLEPYEE